MLSPTSDATRGESQINLLSAPSQVRATRLVTMQIFVQSGLAEPLLVSLPAGATVKDLKNVVEDVEFIPASLQRIVHGSVTLTSGLLAELVPENSVVSLEVGVDGGMRAKWRKKRMRRLRRKRRKMRNRAK